MSHQTSAYHAAGDAARKPVRHSANPPPVDQRHLEDNHECPSRTPGTTAPILDTPTGHLIRTNLNNEIGRSTEQDDSDGMR